MSSCSLITKIFMERLIQWFSMGARIQEIEEMACSPELSWNMLHFVVGARIHEVEKMVCLPELDHASVCKKVCKNMRV